MDSHDIRNLQEAYLEVYQQELDEVLDTPTSRFSYAKKMLPSALKAFVTGDKETLKKRSAGANRGMRKIEKSKEVKERVDLYDLVLTHLLDEGYVNDLESAENIMENMSEEWVYDILESYDLSEHTLDDMYKLYEASGGVIGGRFFRKKKSSNPGQKKSKRIADAIGSAIDRVMGYDIKPNRGPIDIPPEVRERYMRNRKRR